MRAGLQLLAAVALVGVTALAVTLLVREDELVRDLRAHGVVTTGVVTAVTDSSGPRSVGGYRRDVTYRDGLTTVDTVRCRCSAVGDPVTVVHDPDRPERAMTVGRLDAWTRWWFLPAGLLLVLPSCLVVVPWTGLGVLLVSRRYRLARYGDPRVPAEERAGRARDYVAFVNTHQRRPDPTSGDPVEADLARWWEAVQVDARGTREVRLVTDVLALTRL